MLVGTGPPAEPGHAIKLSKRTRVVFVVPRDHESPLGAMATLALLGNPPGRNSRQIARPSAFHSRSNAVR